MTNTGRNWEQFALLLVDVQRDFWSERLAPSFPDFPANIERLLSLCRSEGLEVVHLRASFKPDMSDWMFSSSLIERPQMRFAQTTPNGWRHWRSFRGSRSLPTQDYIFFAYDNWFRKVGHGLNGGKRIGGVQWHENSLK